jgi:hypothetical protein
VYKFEKNGVLIIISLYVDDLILYSNDLPSLNSFKQMIGKKFSMTDLGEAKYVLGIEITRDRSSRTLTLSQAAYTRDVLRRHDMATCNAVRTPILPGSKLVKAAEGYQATAEMTRKYQSGVGALMYASVCTRPDIAYAVGELGQFASNPDKSHHAALQHCLRYLQGTITRSIVYQGTGQPNDIPSLTAYCDSDWGGDLGTRRSTTGYVFILCGGAVAWQSKRQKSVAASTVEAEYMALASAVKEVLWQRSFLNGVGYQLSEPTTLWCDSQGAISLAGNPAHHERTKHIAVRFHLTRHHVAQGDVNLQHVGTLQQAADCLTKGLDWVKHMVGVRLMGMVE